MDENKPSEYKGLDEPIGSSYPDDSDEKSVDSTSPVINPDPVPPVASPRGFSSSNYGQPQNSNMAPLPKPPKKSPKKKVLFILGILLLLICIVGGVLYAQSMKDEPAVNNVVPVSETENVPEESVKLKNTVFVSGEFRASVDYPEGWKVEDIDESVVDDGYDEGVFKTKYLKITSDKGNTLEIHDLSQSGKGGDCGPDLTFNLVKRLDTKTPNAFFAEYSITAVPNVSNAEVKKSYPILPKNTVLGFRYLANASSDASVEKFTALKENDSITTACALPLLHSFYNGEKPSSKLSIYISQPDKGEATKEYLDVTYSEIAEDTEFVKMLQSLDLKGGI